MNLSPEMIQMILQDPSTDPQTQALIRQQKQAQMLREGSMDPVSNTPMAGRIVTPNYGQVFNRFMQGRAADKMQPGIDQQMGAVNERTTRKRQGYMDALLMALRRPTMQQPGSVMPPDGFEDR
jgi:hypothetical protein